MMYRLCKCLLCFLIFSTTAAAQVVPDTTLFHKFYKIGQTGEIFIPLGEIAFADTIVAYYPGNPQAHKPFNNIHNSLGEPDFTTYRTKTPKYTSIGCGGSITFKFTDNGFIDIEGDDLVFFEIGPSIEPFRLEISKDGTHWLQLGHVSGGKSTVDIGQFLLPSAKREVFYYIRITDLKRFCRGPTPGSDIDAVGAIGAVIKLSIDTKVLFDTAKYFLREEAINSLKKLERQLREIPKAELVIKGYTDSDGGYAYNMTLAKNRAKSVRDYLKKHLKTVGEYTFSTESFGETHPVRENTTPQNKQQNRRVEIIVFPSKEFYTPPENHD